MPPTRRALVCALSLLPCVAAAAQQRGQVEVTPFIGLYFPTANLIDETDPGSGATARFEQKSSYSFGARAALWISDRLAAEGTFSYTPSEVKVSLLIPGSPGQSASEGAKVLAAAGRFRYRFGPPAAANARVYHVVGGLAMISRGGTFWNQIEDQGFRVDGRTDFGAVLGGGVDLRVGTTLVLRVAVEDYIHQARFTVDDGSGSGPQESESQMQNDLVLSVGLGVQLARRSPRRSPGV